MRAVTFNFLFIGLLFSSRGYAVPTLEDFYDSNDLSGEQIVVQDSNDSKFCIMNSKEPVFSGFSFLNYSKEYDLLVTQQVIYNSRYSIRRMWKKFLSSGVFLNKKFSEKSFKFVLGKRFQLNSPVTVPVTVPVPGALLLGSIGLVGVSFLRRNFGFCRKEDNNKN